MHMHIVLHHNRCLYVVLKCTVLLMTEVVQKEKTCSDVADEGCTTFQTAAAHAGNKKACPFQNSRVLYVVEMPSVAVTY